MRKRKSWNEQICSIENKGYAAFKEGESIDSNPYVGGHRNQNGSGGQLQRQRGYAWSRGWRLAEAESQEKPA